MKPGNQPLNREQSLLCDHIISFQYLPYTVQPKDWNFRLFDQNILMLACKAMKPGLVEKVLETFPGFDINAFTSRERTALTTAIECCNSHALVALLAREDLWCPPDSVIYQLIDSERGTDALEVFLNMRPDWILNCADESGTPFFFSIQKKNVWDLFRRHPSFKPLQKDNDGKDFLEHMVIWTGVQGFLLDVLFFPGMNLESALDSALSQRSFGPVQLLCLHPEINLPAACPRWEAQWSSWWSEYHRDPKAYRKRAWREHEDYIEDVAGDLFSMVIFHSEGLLALK